MNKKDLIAAILTQDPTLTKSHLARQSKAALEAEWPELAHTDEGAVVADDDTRTEPGTDAPTPPPESNDGPREAHDEGIEDPDAEPVDGEYHEHYDENGNVIPLDEDGPELEGGNKVPDVYRDKYKAIAAATGHKPKSWSGKSTLNNGDTLALRLEQCSPAVVCGMVDTIKEQVSGTTLAKYTTDRLDEGKKPLNRGMVRMNAGNQLRKWLKNQTKEGEVTESEVLKATFGEFQSVI